MPFVFKRLALILSIAAAHAADKETPFKAQPAARYAAHQTNQQITIGVERYLDSEKLKVAFGKLDPNDYGVLPLDCAAAEQEAAALLSFQSDEEDDRLSGGFWFGRRNGEIAPYMNPWVTSFALQALSMWNMRGRFKVDWRELI